MAIELDTDGLVFVLEGQTFTRDEIKRMIQILHDLTETNDYEFPYVVPDLISRASFILKKSFK